MSIFDKDIIEQDTKLHKFCNHVKKWVENEFLPCYRYHYGNLDNVSRSFNRSFDHPDTVLLFEEYGIYNPCFQAVWLANTESFSSVLISIIYTEKKTETLDQDTAKVFLKMKISANQLNQIHWPI